MSKSSLVVGKREREREREREGEIYLAMPKSPTLIILLLVKKMFCVFKSRCKMFLSCMYFKKKNAKELFF